MNCAEYQELVAADADGVLGETERHDAAAHRETCRRCQALVRQQRGVKELVRSRSRHYAAPAELRERILSSLATGDEYSAAVASLTPVRHWRPSRTRLVIAGAVAAAAILILRPLWRSPAPTLDVLLAQDVQALKAPAVHLAMQTSDVEELRRYYRSTGRIDFDRSVDDFTSMGLRLVGGRVAKLRDVDTTFSVFVTADGRRVICRRFRAGALPLPKGGQYFGENQLLTVDGVTIAIIRLGDVICTLATDMPREMFLRHLLAGAHS
jgi:hypothetical protein